MKLMFHIAILVLALSPVPMAYAEDFGSGDMDAGSSGAEGNPGQDLDLMARGAALWLTYCNRCHDYRNPADFTDRRWRLYVSHMRVAAVLTVEEAQAIYHYLASANGDEAP